jgi:MFS family permease
LVFVGLLGLSFVIPYWGILPAILIYVGMGLTNFFVSRYLNEAAPSEQRATVLSFRGLSTNFTYGAVAIFYSLLIASIKGKEGIAAISDSDLQQEAVFIESLGWFPGYFLATVLVVFLVQRLRFGKR